MVNKTGISLLCEKVERNGWKAGLGEFLNESCAFEADQMNRFLYARQAGWRFLLDLDPKAIVLNFETALGTDSLALARHFDKVYTLTSSAMLRKCVEQRIKEERRGKIIVACLEDFKKLPFGDRFFYAIVMHNITAFLPDAGLKNMKNLAIESKRTLAEPGLLFLSFENRPPWLGTQLRKILADAGFRQTRIYPLEGNPRKISQVLGFSGVVSQGNVSFKQRIKSAVFSHKSYGCFSPFVAMTASSLNEKMGFLDKLLNAISQHESLKEKGGEGLAIKQYLILNEKAIISLMERRSKNQVAVVKLPLNEAGLGRCQHEAETLSGLKGLPLSIGGKIPEFLFQGTLQNQPYFVTTACQGYSIDLALPKMEKLVCAAAQEIIQFHAQTCREYTMDEALFFELFGQGLLKIKEMLPDDSKNDLDRIKAFIHGSMMGKTLPVVWGHGDYYHENILVEPKTFSLTGIIDWEHSRKKELPLLDLLYLLLKKEMLFQDADFSQAFIRHLLPLRFNKIGQEFIEAYMGRLKVDKGLLNTLSVMLWIRHLSERAAFSTPKAWSCLNFNPIIKALRERIFPLS